MSVKQISVRSTHYLIILLMSNKVDSYEIYIHLIQSMEKEELQNECLSDDRHSAF